MSKRRMFSQDIIQSDAFLDMPMSSQGLYLHLSMEADDYGFVGPKRVMRMIGANDDDLKILIMKRFILAFESGVVVIKHWQINNTVRKDRSHDTTYQAEYRLLRYNDFGAYTEKSIDQEMSDFVEKIEPKVQKHIRGDVVTESQGQRSTDNNSDRSKTDDGKPNGNQMATETRLDKTRLLSKYKYLLVNNSGKEITVKAPELLTLIIQALGYTQATKITPGRLEKLKSRMRLVSANEIIVAARRIASDPFMQGDNPQGKRYGTIDYLLRNDEQLDRWINQEEPRRESEFSRRLREHNAKTNR